MTWTYDVNTLSTKPLMQVRRLIGDVLAQDQQLQDEEINWTLGRYTTIEGACAELCRDLATQFARMVDISQGEVRTGYSARSRRYQALAAQFERLSLMGATPIAGGISIADKVAVDNDPDRVSPDFNKGMFENTLPTGPVGNQTLNQSGGGDSFDPFQ